MLEVMYVRCTHCGYDNSPEYRFCGMCGASLAHPPAPRPPSPAPPAPAGKVPPEGENGTESVHGPSFLGLAEDPKVEFHYLYEDEQPSSHAGLIFFLIILLGAGGYLAWQWQHNGFPFNRLNANAAPARQAPPSEAAPAPAEEQDTHDKPITGSGDVLPTAPEKQEKETQPESTGKAGEQPAPNKTPTEAPSAAAPGTPRKQQESSTDSDTSEEAKATPPSIPQKAPRAKPQPRPRIPQRPSPALAETPASPDADLELAGERYLYGNGLPQNCARAESSLRTAAMHGNSKAETVLGTMYATGHCVGRDLPTAYRWFARALHQEPQNSRISADLQVLWRQMTPQERQLATSAQ